MGNDTAKQRNTTSETELQTYQQLICMGFEDDIAWKISQKYKGNLNKCIDYFMRQNISKQENNDNNSSITTITDKKTDTKTSKNSHHQQSNIEREKTNVFDEIVDELQFSTRYEHIEHPKSIAIELLKIYQTLLRIDTNIPFDDVNVNLKQLHDDFCDIKHNLINHNNKDILYQTLQHIMNHIGDIACNPNQCKYIQHQYRDRCSSRNRGDHDTDNNDKKHYQHILCEDTLSAIHCFMVHIYDTDLLTPTELKQIEEELLDDTDDINKNDKKQEIISNKLYEKQSNINILSTNGHSKYVSNIYDVSIHSTSNENVPFDSNEQKIDENQYIYDFGVKLTYWKKTDNCYVAPKYSNLKEEITQNKIFNLSIYEWNQFDYNCKFYLDTETAKKYLPKSNGNTLFNIPENQTMDAKHVESLKLYTDYTELCSKLCETFRPQSNAETIVQLRNRNAEYAIWSKLLAESVQSFGKCMTEEEESIQTIYRGISQNFMFNQFVARFNSPTSTSINLCIAQRFAGRNGMILSLSRHENYQCFYFDCSPISAYSESECLFFGGDSILKINTIKCFRKEQWIDYKDDLQAIEFVLQLINGKECDADLLSFKAQESLLNMILYNNKSEVTPRYIKNLLNFHISKASSINLNGLELKEKHKILKNILIKTDGTINVFNIWQFFAATTHLNIVMPPKYLLNEYIIDSLLEDLNNVCLTNTNSTFKQFTFYFDGSISYNQTFLNGYFHKFQKAHWEIQHLATGTSFLWLRYQTIKIMQPMSAKQPKKVLNVEIDPKLYLLLQYQVRNSRLIVRIPFDIFVLVCSYYGKFEKNDKEYNCNIRIWICSWNMANINQWKRIHKSQFEQFIPTDYDLYIFGVQEAVSNALFIDLTEYFQMKDVIRLKLNDSNDAFGVYSRISSQYTGIAVFYKQSLSKEIDLYDTAAVSCGITAGSKGAACVVLSIYGTNIALFSLHIEDCKNLSSLLNKCNNKLFSDSKLTLFERCHHIICFGSFNSKMSISTKEAIYKMSSMNVGQLWNYDSLTRKLSSHNKEPLFNNYFREPIPSSDFYPTYPKKANITTDFNSNENLNEYNTLLSKLNEAYNVKKPLSFCDRLLYFSNVYGAILYPEINSTSVYRNSYCHNYETISNNFTQSTHSAICCGLHLKSNIEKESENKNIEKESEKKYTRTLINNFGSRLNAKGDQKLYDYLIKLLMIGDEVGKRALLRKFCDESFKTNFITTIGIDFKLKTVTIYGKKVKLQIWDTAGGERFRTITTAYYRGVMGIVLVYDITDEQSFLNIRNWIRNIEQHAAETTKKILVGNKCHMTDDRIITKDRGQSLADEYEIQFYESSVTNDINVDEPFIALATEIVEQKIAQNITLLYKYLSNDKALKQHSDNIYSYLNTCSIVNMDENQFAEQLMIHLREKKLTKPLKKLYSYLCKL